MFKRLKALFKEGRTTTEVKVTDLWMTGFLKKLYHRGAMIELTYPITYLYKYGRLWFIYDRDRLPIRLIPVRQEIKDKYQWVGAVPSQVELMKYDQYPSGYFVVGIKHDINVLYTLHHYHGSSYLLPSAMNKELYLTIHPDKEQYYISEYEYNAIKVAKQETLDNKDTIRSDWLMGYVNGPRKSKDPYVELLLLAGIHSDIDKFVQDFKREVG